IKNFEGFRKNLKIQIILFAFEMQKKKLKKCKPSYLHKKVTKNNSKSSNLHTKCKKKLKKNPKKSKSSYCIRNAKKETKKDPIHLSYLHSKCKKEIKSYLHKKVIKNNYKSSNL